MQCLKVIDDTKNSNRYTKQKRRHMKMTSYISEIKAALCCLVISESIRHIIYSLLQF